MTPVIPPVVPSGWVWRPLDSIAEVSVSSVDKKSYDGEKPVRLCNYTDVYYNDQITDDIEFMEATATAEQCFAFAVRAGDVVITKDSESSDDVGRPAYVPRDIPGVVYGYHLAVYRPYDLRYSRFLKYLFDSNWVRTQFELRTPGVTRIGLNRGTLRNLRVPVPRSQVAIDIADFLDRETAEIDILIRELTGMSSLLAERAEAQSESYFSEFLEHATAAELRKSLFEVDERAGDAARPDDLLSVSIHRGVYRWSDYSSDLPRAEDMSRYKVVASGDLVLNRMRAFQGGMATAPTSGITSPDYAVLRTSARVLPEFIAELFRSRRFQFEIRCRLRGIGSRDSGQVRTPRISVSDLIRIPVSIPCMKKQQEVWMRWRAYKEQAWSQVQEVEEAITLAYERRAALITAAVTGQIDVTAKNKPVVEQLEDELAEAR